jgi:hypothetical protein
MENKQLEELKNFLEQEIKDIKMPTDVKLPTDVNIRYVLGELYGYCKILEKVKRLLSLKEVI